MAAEVQDSLDTEKARIVGSSSAAELAGLISAMISILQMPDVDTLYIYCDFPVTIYLATGTFRPSANCLRFANPRPPTQKPCP